MGEGFPLWSLAPMAWGGRDPLRDWIYLSVSAFSDSTPSPFLKYPKIHNSDWGESFAQIFLVKFSFVRKKKSVNHLTGGPRESRARPGGWRAPYLVATSDTVSRWFFLRKIPNILKIILLPFLSRLDSVWYWFSAKHKTCNKQELALGTWSIC